MHQSIENYDFKLKRALIRVDFNVPLDENLKVTDDRRIKATIPTIRKVLQSGGAAVLMSHMGRPKGVDPKLSLRNVLYKLEELLGQPVEFAEDCQNAQADVSGLQVGEVLLLENLRFYAEETGKPRLPKEATENQIAEAKEQMKTSQKRFTETLASYGDCYINDAFGTAHRAHVSTSLIAEYFPVDKMFGYVMEEELKAVNSVMGHTVKPFTAIVGGSKVSSKIEIIESLMERVDNLIICGGMSYTFEAAQGGKIGNSLCEEEQFDVALSIIRNAEARNVKLYFAEDSLCGDNFNNQCNQKVYPSNQIPDGWMGLDIGPKAAETFAKVIKKSKTILWNGPAGVCEMSSFAKGSRAIGEAVVEATAAGAYSLIGGGDTAACINQFNITDKVSYVSTGGGALLEYMEGRKLPGIEAILEK